jgi:putative endonuclease
MILAGRRHGTLYIGVTNSLQKRLREHRNGQGSSFVKAYGVHRLAYVETFERPDEAITREKQLNLWKRDCKVELIEGDNAEWRDLSDLLALFLCFKLTHVVMGPCFRRDDTVLLSGAILS